MIARSRAVLVGSTALVGAALTLVVAVFEKRRVALPCAITGIDGALTYVVCIVWLVGAARA